ncbi:hypothetical protein HNE_1224 [Hyphomonas neptunium ATCC 15444]|uniref:Uncharacterized protein n=2 Tax=Hyphomonas TaxID=85 RepID=Q0C2V1_HYPNA|nr:MULTISPECIES: hypothetical protein [Hyphomonas]ABI77588.1 hypothetical protein HNE_1224 [Hyphomonas neptunium ATCC 15444]KCZ95822.1 hypothetical protein HHI_03587 [Hyphomonas hirschiana VP5]
MTPQIARLYAHVSPVFWPYLWLQLRWIFKRQDKELRTLLISVTRWGQVHIVQVGDHWRAYRKPEALKPGWDDPVWQSAVPPNMVGVFLEESQTSPTQVFGGIPLEAHPEQSRRISGLTPDTS